MKPSTSSYQDLFRKMTTLSLATAFAGQFLVSPCQAAQTSKAPYKIRIEQGFIKPEEGPSLNRNDIKNAGDPFDSSGTGTEDALEPPSGAFQVQTTKTGNPPPFHVRADEDGGFNGQGMPGMGDQMPQEQAPRQQLVAPEMQPPTQVNQMRPNNPNDPDGQDMQLAWDEWHQRVAAAIYNQISGLAKTMLSKSPPLVCIINYTITKEGRVVNVHMQQNSSSIVYNAMVYAVVSKMAGNPVLQFPQGSRRMTVDKLSTFSHNCGPNQGFRSITGDKERLLQQQRGR
jgi:hypothetical protein